MLRARIALSVVAAALTFAIPANASAAQVIGQTGNPINCGENLPYVQTVLGGGPSYSPSAYGVITSWSHMGDSMVNKTAQLLVLRHNPSAGATHFIKTQEDQVRTTMAGVLNTYSGIRLPIEPNERLGIFLPLGQPGGLGSCAFTAAGNTINWPATSGSPPFNTSVDYAASSGNLRINASAVVEPDTDRDVFGDESQDNCLGTAGTFNGCPNTVTLGKATARGKAVAVEVTVPGAGTLAAGSVTDKALPAAAAKKKKKKATSPLKQASQTVTSKTKQTVTLTLNLSKAGKAKLAQKGKLNLSIRVVYTPTGGTAGSVTTTAKLRRQNKKR